VVYISQRGQHRVRSAWEGSASEGRWERSEYPCPHEATYPTVNARTDTLDLMATQSHGLFDHPERECRRGQRARCDQAVNLRRGTSCHENIHGCRVDDVGRQPIGQ
jgi:hypothetical protein